MNKDFIPYEQALELKELGYDDENYAAFYFHKHNEIDIEFCHPFNEPSIEDASYYGVRFICVAPTYSQAFRFFRDKFELFHKIDAEYHIEGDPTRYYEHNRTVLVFKGHIYGRDNHKVNGYVDTYEEAELLLLKKIIILVKEQIAEVAKWICEETDKMVVEEMIKMAENKQNKQ
jgi:hypothetical protein